MDKNEYVEGWGYLRAETPEVRIFTSNPLTKGHGAYVDLYKFEWHGEKEAHRLDILACEAEDRAHDAARAFAAEWWRYEHEQAELTGDHDGVSGPWDDWSCTVKSFARGGYSYKRRGQLVPLARAAQAAFLRADRARVRANRAQQPILDAIPELSGWGLRLVRELHEPDTANAFAMWPRA